MKELLTEENDLQLLYNHKAEKYNIQDIMGMVKKDDHSKNLLYQVDKNHRAIDELGRPINAKGYLVDS